MLHQVVQSCVKLCQVLSNCVDLCQVVSSFVKFCQFVIICVKLYQGPKLPKGSKSFHREPTLADDVKRDLDRAI